MARTRTPRRTSTLGEIIPKGEHFRARYTRNATTHTPGRTFPSFALADQWLAAEQLLIAREEWTPPAKRRAAAEAAEVRDSLTFKAYALRWIDERQVRGQALRPSTVDKYKRLLDAQLAPLAKLPLVDIDKPTASAWYHALDATKATTRAHAYALAKAILTTAAEDGIIPTNPLQVRGAGRPPRKPDVELFTPAQVAALADAMPPEHRAAVLLAAWCGLRFGELAALRRHDLELPKDGPARVHVRRGVVLVAGKQTEAETKTAAGVRTVPVPPHIVDDLRDHLKAHTQWGAEGLLFPTTNPAMFDYLTPSQLYGKAPQYRKDGTVSKNGRGYYRARHIIGRDDLNFHKLRHFAATNYAVAGATTRELLAVMGHADAAVAMRYQHAASDRLSTLAANVSTLAAVEAATGQEA